LLLVGPFLTGFALVGPWFLPLILGSRWQPVLALYPFISLGILLNVVFNMHSSALYVLKRNWSVALFHLSHTLLFSFSAFLLVRHFGILGYGLAEVIALLSYFVIHFRLEKELRPSYSNAWPWVLGFGPPLFAPILPHFWIPLLFLPLLIVLLQPIHRKQVAQLINYILKRKPKKW
jgi:O-antigen/teichoic acid export membrane protein